MDRFHRDSSLDRATRLKEAQRRRAGYLADLKKRDRDQQRGRRHLYDNMYNHDHRDDANERPDALFQDIVEASSAGVTQEHREIYHGLSRADAATQGTGGTRTATAGSGSPSPRSSHNSPRSDRSPMRTRFPTRPATTPAAAATRRVKSSPARLCRDGSPPKDNRQAANDRAVQVYSASAGDRRTRQSACFGGDRVSRSPPPWDNRMPSPSAAEQHRRRLSPRENGRQPMPWPLDDVDVVGAGQVRVLMSHGPLRCALFFGLGYHVRKYLVEMDARENPGRSSTLKICFSVPQVMAAEYGFQHKIRSPPLTQEISGCAQSAWRTAS